MSWPTSQAQEAAEASPISGKSVAGCNSRAAELSCGEMGLMGLRGPMGLMGTESYSLHGHQHAAVKLAHADGAVVAGVGAGLPVVAHDEVLPVIQPKLCQCGQRIGFGSRLEVGFGQFAVVDLDPAGLDADRFPGQADDSFDGLPVHAVVDYDDVAALKVAHAGAPPEIGSAPRRRR